MTPSASFARTENSNPRTMVMKAAENSVCRNTPNTVSRTEAGRIFAQRPVSPDAIVVVGVALQNLPEPGNTGAISAMRSKSPGAPASTENKPARQLRIFPDDDYRFPGPRL